MKCLIPNNFKLRSRLDDPKIMLTQNYILYLNTTPDAFPLGLMTIPLFQRNVVLATIHNSCVSY